MLISKLKPYERKQREQYAKQRADAFNPKKNTFMALFESDSTPEEIATKISVINFIRNLAKDKKEVTVEDMQNRFNASPKETMKAMEEFKSDGLIRGNEASYSLTQKAIKLLRDRDAQIRVVHMGNQKLRKEGHLGPGSW